MDCSKVIENLKIDIISLENKLKNMSDRDQLNKTKIYQHEETIKNLELKINEMNKNFAELEMQNKSNIRTNEKETTAELLKLISEKSLTEDL